MTPAFVEQFTQRIANVVSRQFNKRNPELEAETSELRVTILHESVAKSGRSISIRKTPPLIRLTAESAIAEKFCSEELLAVLINCVKTKMNITFCGMPGIGKTECVKFFSQFIPANERVITIEDTLELRYAETNPGKDCIEMKVSEDVFGYSEAIKSCLRMNPKWIMLSEARSKEVKYLLQSWSTGVRGMTTLHTDDVRNIPDRILNMLESRVDAERMENDIYQALDVGILIRKRRNEDGVVYRYIDQVCFFYRENYTNHVFMLVSDGQIVTHDIPKVILRRFKREGVNEPFGESFVNEIRMNEAMMSEERAPLTLIGGPLQHVLETEHGITRNGREMLVIALKNSREMLNMLNKVLRFDDNANFLVNGGLNENINEKGNEMEKVEGEIDDTTVSKYLKELEEEKKKEKAKHEEEENQKGTAPDKPSKNLTILVVEDNSDLRLYLNSVLEEKYNVLLAENGKVGLYKARTEMPDFILTDVTMPVMDGITMIREIKQDRTISHIPIIILSAKASVEDQLKGFEQGVDGYLTKPFSTSYLIGRIEAAINKRKAAQTDIAKMMKQNGNVGYTGKVGNTGNAGNTEAAEIFQPATEPRKTLSELNFDIQEKERLAEEKKSKMKSYAFMESQINDKTMGRILKYVTDNMGSPDLKIDDIADAIGMSRSVLYNKIKQAVGMTPIDFVRHIRIMRACELLQQTNDPLTSIAFEVGFSDPKYFSKVFKKELGIVPSEYRERTKE